MFSGSMVAIATPMVSGGAIDLTALYNLLDWHIDSGTNGIVLLGTTGEAPTIKNDERSSVIGFVAKHLKQRIPLIVGTGTNNTMQTIKYTHEAMEAGADACLLVTPYYNKPTVNGLIAHFSAVAEAVPIPQILYNVPGRTGCDLLPETANALAEHDNIIGIKEATGDLKRLEKLQIAKGSGFDAYSGDDATGCEFMLAGGRGVVSVTANIAPELMQQMAAAALAGDKEQARKINNKLQALHEALFVESNPIPCKWLLHRMGKIGGGIRLPLTTLSKSYESKLKSVADDLGIKLTR